MIEAIRFIWSNYLIHIFDIIIVAFIFYRLLLLLKGTRAIHLLIGIAILGLLTIISRDILKLKMLSWLLENFWLPGVIIIAIVFQPELRSLFIQLGYAPLMKHVSTSEKYVYELVEAIKEMSSNKIGSIIVIEREIGLKDFVESGVTLNADITKELISSIFYPYSPLHDGAIIIKGDKILSAKNILPLTDRPEIHKRYGMRHKAAIGITEMSDAIAIVVSEETGNISLASHSKLEKISKPEDLIEILKKCLKK